jgi:hypothetical protein
MIKVVAMALDGSSPPLPSSGREFTGGAECSGTVDTIPMCLR